MRLFCAEGNVNNVVRLYRYASRFADTPFDAATTDVTTEFSPIIDAA